MEVVRPADLTPGDEIRVVAPSRSLAMIGAATREIANRRFAELGLVVSFGAHVEESDEFVSTSIEARVSDIHAAFADPSIKGILSVIGGYNSNQLLPHLDWDLIRSNPKVVCGYSDITALTCGIWAKTGLVTYSGPHYSTFGMLEHMEQTASWFKQSLMGVAGKISPADTWTDDPWYLDQQQRVIEANDGYWVMRHGFAEGRMVGGNLCTLNLLQGTEYMPPLDGAVVFIEDDFESMPHTFDRDLTSLSQQPGFDRIAGLVIGRFQRAVGMTRPLLAAIIESNRRLDGVPILANVDFGHTDPILTIPVGGLARLEVGPESSHLELLG